MLSEITRQCTTSAKSARLTATEKPLTKTVGDLLSGSTGARTRGTVGLDSPVLVEVAGAPRRLALHSAGRARPLWWVLARCRPCSHLRAKHLRNPCPRHSFETS